MSILETVNFSHMVQNVAKIITPLWLIMKWQIKFKMLRTMMEIRIGLFNIFYSLPKRCFLIFQNVFNTLKLQIGCVSLLCILISFSACSILCSYYRSVPYIKKNILTRLDELYVINFTFLACSQCLLCLFSLVCEARNDYVYLVFFFTISGSRLLAVDCQLF